MADDNIDADVRDPESVLGAAALHETLDLTRPVGLTLVAVMHFLEDSEEPSRILGALVDALPAGSFVALSHACGDAAGAARLVAPPAEHPAASSPHSTVAAGSAWRPARQRSRSRQLIRPPRAAPRRPRPES